MSSKNKIKIVQTMEDLNRALQEISETPYSIVLCNVLSKLKFGNREINIHFPTALYTEEETLLLPENALLSKEEFQERAERAGAHVVGFLPHEEEKIDQPEKELQFVNNGRELIKEVNDRIDWEDCFCNYHPKMKGKLSLYHVTEDGEKMNIGETKINGVIDFDDKVLALTFPANYRAVYQVLWEEGAFAEQDWETDYPFVESGIGAQAK